MEEITNEYVRKQVSKGKQYTLVIKKMGPPGTGIYGIKGLMGFKYRGMG